MGFNLTSVSLAVLLGVLTTACGGKAVPVPESPPPRVVEPSTLAEPAPESESPAPLVAPPPAYGNKVVLARRVTNETSAF
jgi:hypothetical protein